MQARSMTGYGFSELESDLGKARIELRALNHRFLEVSINLPGTLSSKESEIRSRIAEHVKRARIDVWIHWVPNTERTAEVAVNHELLAVLHRVLEEARNNLGIQSGEVGMDVLTRFPDVVNIERAQAAITDEAYEQINRCLDEAQQLGKKAGSLLMFV